MCRKAILVVLKIAALVPVRHMLQILEIGRAITAVAIALEWTQANRDQKTATARTIPRQLSTEPAVQLNLQLLGRASSMTVIVHKGSNRIVTVDHVDFPNGGVVCGLPSGSGAIITSKRFMARVEMFWLDSLALPSMAVIYETPLEPALRRVSSYLNYELTSTMKLPLRESELRLGYEATNVCLILETSDKSCLYRTSPRSGQRTSPPPLLSSFRRLGATATVLVFSTTALLHRAYLPALTLALILSLCDDRTWTCRMFSMS